MIHTRRRTCLLVLVRRHRVEEVHLQGAHVGCVVHGQACSWHRAPDLLCLCPDLLCADAAASHRRPQKTVAIWREALYADVCTQLAVAPPSCASAPSRRAGLLLAGVLCCALPNLAGSPPPLPTLQRAPAGLANSALSWSTRLSIQPDPSRALRLGQSAPTAASAGADPARAAAVRGSVSDIRHPSLYRPACAIPRSYECRVRAERGGQQLDKPGAQARRAGEVLHE